MISFQKLHSRHVLAKNMSCQRVIKGIVIVSYHEELKGLLYKRQYLQPGQHYKDYNVPPDSCISCPSQRACPLLRDSRARATSDSYSVEKKKHKSSYRIHHWLLRLFLLFKFVRSKTKESFVARTQRACDWRININRWRQRDFRYTTSPQ